MKNFYKIALVCLIGIFTNLSMQAQERVIVVEPHDTLNLNEFILADTNAAGDWNDPENTVYELKQNSVYKVSSQIDVRDTKLHIRGQEGTGQKAVILQRVKETGGYNKMLYTRGDAIIENVRISAEEAGTNYSWNAIRIYGANSTVVFRNCIIEKQGGSVAALYGEGVDITLDRCECRYLGQPTRVTGNGRIIDGRKASSRVKIVDCIFYNIMATAFAGWGNEHKYVEIDHNTFLNMAGENRLFQFSKYVDTVKITNNILMNCFFAGDYPNKMMDDKIADEKWGDNTGVLAIFNLPDSIPTDKNKWTISNNNVFNTPDLADSMATYPDSIVLPPVMSPNYEAWRGDLADDVYFEEVLEFPSVPATPTWVWKNFYNDAEGTLTEHGYFVPVHPQDTQADTNWYKFDVNGLDVSYPCSSTSATAATDGGPVGSRLFSCNASAIKNKKLNTLDVSAFPNPASSEVTFIINDKILEAGELKIYSITGEVIEQRLIERSEKEITVDVSDFSRGIFLYQLTTSNGNKAGRLVVE